MHRAFTNILCEDIEATAKFYTEMLGMTRAGDFGWFVILSHDAMPGFELGLLARDHETVPAEIAQSPSGVVLTFVVDDLEAIQDRAVRVDAPIVHGPTDLPYGQRRLMLRDPEGTAVDVSAPIAPVTMT